MNKQNPNQKYTPEEKAKQVRKKYITLAITTFLAVCSISGLILVLVLL